MDISQSHSSQWLNEKLQDYDSSSPQISDPVFDAVRNFGIIWNMFEKEASSILKSRGEIINSEEQITLSIAEEFLPRENVLNEVYNFFRPRYVYNGEVNNYFDILWPNDRSKRSRDLIVNLLKKNDVLPFEKNTVCAMICLRLRCNLFHGVKELWTLRVQSQLFNIADYYLEAMIDRMLNPEAQ